MAAAVPLYNETTGVPVYDTVTGVEVMVDPATGCRVCCDGSACKFQLFNCSDGSKTPYWFSAFTNNVNGSTGTVIVCGNELIPYGGGTFPVYNSPNPAAVLIIGASIKLHSTRIDPAFNICYTIGAWVDGTFNISESEFSLITSCEDIDNCCNSSSYNFSTSTFAVILTVTTTTPGDCFAGAYAGAPMIPIAVNYVPNIEAAFLAAGGGSLNPWGGSTCILTIQPGYIGYDPAIPIGPGQNNWALSIFTDAAKCWILCLQYVCSVPPAPAVAPTVIIFAHHFGFSPAGVWTVDAWSSNDFSFSCPMCITVQVV